MVVVDNGTEVSVSGADPPIVVFLPVTPEESTPLGCGQQGLADAELCSFYDEANRTYSTVGCVSRGRGQAALCRCLSLTDVT